MKAGQLPNLEKLRAGGGFSHLGTSTPPQSPVAWANFINGAGPGSHGIFDFIHRHPARAVRPVLLRRRDAARRGRLGGRRPPAPARLLAVQPQAARDRAAPPGDAVLGLPRRRGRAVDVLRPAVQLPGQPVAPRPPPLHLRHGHARHAGTYGTYQHFAEDGPAEPLDEGGGKRSRLTFEDETARAAIVGPGRQPAQEARPDRRSSSSSTATARPTRP